MKRHASPGLLLVALCLALPAIAQDETTAVTPLVLDGQTSLEVEASPGLELGPTSTIEFVIATAWEDEDGVAAYPAVLGRREPYEGDEPAGFSAATQYSVHVTPDRQAIGLFDGEHFASVPFDFSDGKLHHVALVTQGGSTTVYVDREVRGTLALGLGEPTDLPLYVGSSDGGSELFMGAMPSVRLWRTALTADQVRAIADVLGAPDENAGVDVDDLAVYCDLTGPEPELVVLEEEEAIATGALPSLPQRGEVEPRGLVDKLKQKQQSSKQKNLQASVTETEQSLAARQAEAARIRARLAQYADAVPVQSGQLDVGGSRFRIGRVRVGDRVVGLGTAGREQRRLEKRLTKVDREVAKYTEKLDGPPDYAGGSARRGLRQRLADVTDRIEGDAAADRILGEITQAPIPVRQPGVLGRLRRPQLYYRKNPEVGEAVSTDAGDLQVQKVLGAGAFGGAWLATRTGADGQPEVEVLKQIAPPTAARIESYRQRMQQFGENIDFDRDWGEGGPNGQPGLTPQQALVAKQTAHEVEMQQLAAESGHPAFVPAGLAGKNRMRQGYAGTGVSELLKDPVIDAASPQVKEAMMRIVLEQALDAAVAMKRQGIVHRDLHFGNLAMGADGQLKIIDFGLAKRSGDPDLVLELNSGIGIGGNYGTMSPEATRAMRGQLKNGEPEATTDKSDVFTIGDTFEALYRSAGAQPAFVGIPDSPMRALLRDRLKTTDPDQRPDADEALAQLRAIEAPNPADLEAARRLLADRTQRLVAAQLEGVPGAPEAPGADLVGVPRPPAPNAGNAPNAGAGDNAGP